MRRGFVAFGDTTDVSTLPSSGVVRYTGSLHGWFTYDKNLESQVIVGQVEATVDFSTRIVTLTFSGTRVNDSSLTVVTVSLTSGASGRFYGAVGAGSSGTGPAEIAGIFQLQGVGNGPVSIGGVLLKRM